ncbi:MAG: hypothetical protein ACKVWR_15195 [Acidimicrobiales bacterium]
MLDGARRLLTDRFEVEARRGRVGAEPATDGQPRRVLDAERRLSIDHGALRIGPLARPGWGREGIAYGPFERRPGRVLAVHLLNGHNTSESYALEGMPRRVARWAVGSQTDPLWQRALRFPLSRQRESPLRKLECWWHSRKPAPVSVTDNLMVGWFPAPDAAGPAAGGSGVVVHATGPYNGELRVTAAGGAAPVFRGLQNLPVHYVSVLRERGAMHYAASAYAGAKGLPAYPLLRPLGVDDRPLPEQVSPCLHQAVLGQIGFSCDTRLYEVVVEDHEPWATWCSSAVVADRFAEPPGPFTERGAERGGAWTVEGGLRIDDSGVGAEPDGAGSARLEAESPAGLVHLVIEGLTEGAEAGLAWRSDGPDDEWRVVLRADEIRIETVVAGEVVRKEILPRALGPGAHRLQLNDDGAEVRVALDGLAVAEHGWVDERLTAQRGVALALRGPCRVRDLEVHPRVVALPPGVLVPNRPIPLGGTDVVDFGFERPAADLDGEEAAPGLQWRKTMGRGRLAVVEPGIARFDADLDRPVPDRTIYSFEWRDPGFCDLEVTACAPAGAGGGAGHRSRVGLFVAQDDTNYFTVNIYLDDFYPAASASCFFHLRGFEDIYDAVWANLGELVSWQAPFRIRLVCAGDAYLVLINDEPVLHRALSDVHPATEALRIQRVGLLANWEWGNDTGSTVTRFRARGR